MTPERWALYMDLQTTMAYSGARPAPLNPSVLKASVEFFQLTLARFAINRPKVLIIGPWGHTEVIAWQQAGAGEVHVLTAYPAEAVDLFKIAPAYVGDIHEMPFESASFDVIWASNVLEHVFAPYIALMECRRVLRPFGLTLFTVPSFEGGEGGIGPFHLHCLDAPVWKELLRKTGHRVTQELRTPGGFIGTVSVQELLQERQEGTFLERTGCAHYWMFISRPDTPPGPHARIFEALVNAC